MIKRISDERARIDGYKLAVGAAEFFNNRAYDEDFEWLILAYLGEILSSIGRQAPEYAQKLQPPNPDFQTYLGPGIAQAHRSYRGITSRLSAWEVSSRTRKERPAVS